MAEEVLHFKKYIRVFQTLKVLEFGLTRIPSIYNRFLIEIQHEKQYLNNLFLGFDHWIEFDFLVEKETKEVASSV